MALKFQIETPEALEELPEAIREFYTESNGKYVLAVEGVKPEADFVKVTGALTNERKALKALKDQYDPWASTFQGKTPAEIQAELERIPLLEADASGKFDKTKVDAMVESAARNRMAPVEKERDTYKSQLAERDAIIKSYEDANRSRTIFDAVREVAAKDPTLHESTYASPKGALMLLSSQCLTIDETTGKVVVRDDVEGMTPGLGVKDALAELKNQHPYLAKVSLGGGATGSNGVSGSANVFRQNNMTLRSQFIASKPDGSWKKQMEAAGLKAPMQKYEGK